MWAVLLISAFYFTIHGCDALKNANIVNGSVYPYLVRISEAEHYICTGVILNSSWVLGSADCLTNESGVPNSMENIYVVQGYGDEHVADRLIIHEDYNYKTGTENIALLHLETPLVFSSTIQPAVLATIEEDDVYSYDTCTMVHAYEDRYIHATSEIIDLQECRDLHKNKELVLKPNKHACTFNEERKYVACENGCMGTTLVCGPKDDRKVFGILNYKIDLKDKCENPEVYTLFSGFKEWTEQGQEPTTTTTEASVEEPDKCNKCANEIGLNVAVHMKLPV